MTREEVIRELEFAKFTDDYMLHETVDEAIKLLKQDSDMLDKIRAEINSPNRGTCDYFIVDRIEEIIDECK